MATNQKLLQVQNQAHAVQLAMIDNINKTLARGEQIENLDDKARMLEERASIFNKDAKALRRKMCMKNARNGFIIFIILALIIGFIVLIISRN
jgi:hypothetical protein